MDKCRFNAFKWLLIAFPAVWGVLAFMAWHEVAQCGHLFGPRCSAVYREGIIKFTSLAWVWEYQTLVAGVLALLGAITVLKAAKYTTDKKQQTEDRKQKAAAEVACSIVRAEFRDEIIKLQSLLESPQKPRHFAKAPFPQSYMYLPTLCAISPIFGPFVAARMRDVIDTLHFPNEKNVIQEIAYSEVIFYMLIQIQQRLSPEGRYDMNGSVKLRSKYMRSALANLNWRLEDTAGFWCFFDDGTT